MTSLTDFLEHYKTFSNSELLHILENHDDFQPDAVRAAQMEWDSRQLTNEEVLEARQPILELNHKKETYQRKVQDIKEKFRNTSNSFLETLNPIQTGIPTAEKKLRFIILVFSIIFLYKVVMSFSVWKFFFVNFSKIWIQSIMVLLPIILLSTALITLISRRKIGLYLMTVFLVLSIIENLFGLCFALFWKPYEHLPLDLVIPQPSPIPYLLRGAFFGGCLYILLERKTLELFAVRRKKLLTVILFTAMVYSFLLWRLWIEGS